MLRIEDTDQQRKVENGIQGIVDSLKKYDIHFDEGNWSESESVGAYPCFASKEELEEIRLKQEKAGVNIIGYYGEWAVYRDLEPEKVIEKIMNGEKYIIRFKSMGDINGRISYIDLVKGLIDMPQNVLDIVIIKDDGLPTYHFAHVVDDHLMHTTHVIRSSEWTPSIPLYLELFDTFGFERPSYCHYAPMLKNDFKRDNEGNVEVDSVCKLWMI